MAAGSLQEYMHDWYLEFGRPDLGSCIYRDIYCLAKLCAQKGYRDMTLLLVFHQLISIIFNNYIQHAGPDTLFYFFPTK